MFKNVLREIVENTEGGISSILMGFDGIAVDSYSKENSQFDPEDIGMEYSVVLGQIKQAAEMLEIGITTEVAIQAEQMTAIIRLLNEDYFAAVLVTPGGNYGKARYLLRSRAETILSNLD